MNGLPKINVNFFEKGADATRRSGRGVVALILKDDTPMFDEKSYNRFDEVDKDDYSPENLDAIRNVFRGSPASIIVEVLGAAEEGISVALTRLRTKRFNYMAMPEATAEDNTAIASFVKSSDKNDNNTFKAVLANSAEDDETVINFTTEGIVTEEREYTAQEFTPRMAGIFAGLQLDRSGTYLVLRDVLEIENKEDPDGAVNDGELILIDDGRKIKIGRAVNSLTSTDEPKGDSFKKIKIVEGVHLIKEDIRTNFEDNYVGKFINDYDNKVLFTASTNAYFKEMEKGYVLDRGFDNVLYVDLEGQRRYIEGQGIDTVGMTDQDILEHNTGSHVFTRANIKFVDAMEDLDFDVHM